MSDPIKVFPKVTELGDEVERMRDFIRPMAARLMESMAEIERTSPGSRPKDMVRALSLSLAGFFTAHLNEDGLKFPPQAAANLAQQLISDFQSALRHRQQKERVAWAAQQPGG